MGVEPRWWPKTPEEAIKQLHRVTSVNYVLMAYALVFVGALSMVVIPWLGISKFLDYVRQIRPVATDASVAPCLALLIAWPIYVFYVVKAWFGKIRELPRQEDLMTRVVEGVFHIPITQEAKAHFERLLYMYEDTDDDDE